MTDYSKYLRAARSFVLFALGLAAPIAASGLLPDPYDAWAPVIIAAAVAAGAYHVTPPSRGENTEG